MFSKRCFSEWCVQRVVRIRKGKRHQNALKHWSFQVLFVPLKKLSCVKAKVRNLKNTEKGMSGQHEGGARQH